MVGMKRASSQWHWISCALLVSVAGLCSAQDDEAGISFASYYGSHMVLHRAPRQASVWGYTRLGYVGSMAVITLIDPSGKVVFAKDVMVLTVPALQKGLWHVQLPAMPAGGPYKVRAQVTLLEQPAEAEIWDVHFGDVWLCSGQSNMEISVDHAFNDTEEMAGASSYPNIRLFTVGRSWSEVPEDDLTNIFLNWTRPDSAVVGKYSALCWSFGRKVHEYMKGVPIGLVSSSWGGTRIEAWSSDEALERCGEVPIVKQIQNRASFLWNAMIHPLLQMTITGVAWYQGEFNAREMENTYSCRFPAMINDWRQKFLATTDGQTDPNFPFGFVQLAPDEKNDPTFIGGFPSLRWMQTANVGFVPNKQMANTFMAVAMDLPDPDAPNGPNHPRDKSTISDRLLLGLRHVGLRESQVQYQGPMPTAYQLSTDSSSLSLRMGSTSRDTRSRIAVRNSTGFEVCCAPNTDVSCAETATFWKPVRISRYTDDSITLAMDSCKSMKILAHRYAWRSTPCLYKKCAIYNKKNELPTPPYVKYGLLKNDMGWHDIRFEE